MKTKKVKVRQGFTIVELVIVIGVIGVLTAVLIPTFINLNKKAEMASQQSFLKNVNTQLAMRKAEGAKLETMHDAMEIADEMGFDVEKISPIDGNDIVYDMKANRFAMMKGAEVTYSDGGLQGTGTEIWKIADSDAKAAAISNAGYSIYAKESWNIGNLAAIKVGFDVGKNITANSVSYTGGANPQTVVIRTNSANTNLILNAGGDTVNHFGSVGNVDAQKIDMNCYNEFGKAAYVKITEGKVVAKAGGSISVVFAANNDASKVAVIKEAQGAITKGLTVIQPVSDTNEARTNGIPLEYSIDGTTAASMSEEEKTAAIATREVAVNEQAEAAVEANLIEEIEASGLYEARIGTVGYATLDEAYGEAHNGDTIVMLNSINRNENTEVVTRGMAVSLDLNGNTYKTESEISVSLSNMGYKASAICYSFADTNSPAFEIKNGSILTKYGAGIYVDDPGVDVTLSNLNIHQDHENYVQTTVCYSSAVRLTYNAKATINSGTYEGYVAIDIESSALGKNGHVVVNGGTFNGLLHVYKGSTPLDFVVNGGTFKNTGLTYEQFSSFVSSGKTITTNSDGSWTVSNQ